MNYLNEWSPFAAQWCRNLAQAGEIPACVVDETDIRLVTGDRLSEYKQCHFFAGIAGWPLALKLAGVPEDFPVWTGSCPCQPFSRIGKRKGTEDSRHLWPEFRRLYRIGQPAFMFGEQVAGKDGESWLESVQADLQADGYAFLAAELCSPLVAADHDRARLYWGAWNTVDFRPVQFAGGCDEDGNCPVCGVDYSECECPGPTEDGVFYAETDAGLYGCRLVYRSSEGPQGHGWYGDEGEQSGRDGSQSVRPIAKASSSLRFVECENGKWRRFQPGSFPMAHGIPRSLGRGKSELDRMARDARANRVGRIEGYGNAIVPELAALFITEFFGSIWDQVES